MRKLLAALLVASLIPTARDPADSQWHLEYLRISEAQAFSKGRGITVAVVDSGVSPHRDLAKNLLQGTSFIPGDTGFGTSDQQGHGTAMAGLIAASGETDSGLHGVAPEAKILPVRTSGINDNGSSTNVAKGIAWATDHDANIINISMAGGPNSAIRQAIEAAILKDVIVIASSGNKPKDSIIQFPAYVDGVIAVGAVDAAGDPASISVGGDKLTLVAPGTDIVSTGLSNESRIGTGTSPSAAIVSGVAALVWSRYPELSAVEVVHRMTATAVDKGAPGRDPEYGFGIVDPVAALTADVPPLGASGEPSRSQDAGAPQTGAEDGVPTILGVIIAGLAATALVIALLVVRRRRRSAPAATDT